MGTVVVSVDAELSNHRQPTEREKRRARYGWRRLVDLFETYDVPATWAVVGRLFTETDEMEDRPTESWFTEEAATAFDDVDRTVDDRRILSRSLSGVSLIKALLESNPEHDIGCHSYSHPRFSNITREQADAELTAAALAMAEWGIEPRSFVYPFNAVAHRGALVDNGYICYRETLDPGVGQERPTPDRPPYHPFEVVPESVKWWAGWALDRLSEAYDSVISDTPPPLVEPTVQDNGLIAVPASLPQLYRMPLPVRQVVRSRRGCPVERIVKRGIDTAIEEDGIFHFWFHPGDFDVEADFQSLASILEYTADRRAAGDLQTRTMAEIADRTLNSSRP
jgi:peptidoglycan/xylan/chitin deacetylase (PgdA/CDA1 family)